MVLCMQSFHISVLTSGASVCAPCAAGSFYNATGEFRGMHHFIEVSHVHEILSQEGFRGNFRLHHNIICKYALIRIFNIMIDDCYTAEASSAGHLEYYHTAQTCDPENFVSPPLQVVPLVSGALLDLTTGLMVRFIWRICALVKNYRCCSLRAYTTRL